MKPTLLAIFILTNLWGYSQCDLALTSTPIDCNTLVFHIQGADVGNVSWNYGDGVTGTSNINSDHNYSTNGSYVVTATYSGPACPLGMTMTTEVVVACAVEPICPTALSVSAIECDLYGFAVDGFSEGQVLWNFGDNSTTSSGVTADHAFASNGSYVVTANYFGPTCQAGVELHANISVECPVQPICPTEILVQSTNTCQMPLFLLNTEAQTGEAVTWYPGDGSGPIAGGHGFEHLYDNPGTYEVCVNYTSPSCPNGTEICTSVIVEACPTPQCPEAIVAESLDCNSFVFHVTGIDAAQVNWNFGDGAFVTGNSNADHHYASNGTYVVYATILVPNCPQSNPNGVVTLIYTIQVNCAAEECPTSIAHSAAANACQTIHFEIGSATPGENVIWYPGDETGAVQSTHNFTHTYASTGTYQVCAFYTSEACPSGIELCTEVIVEACQQPACPTEVIAIAGVNCQTAVFSLNGDAQSGEIITWYPGDGTGPIAGGHVLEHIYANPGTYAVCCVYSSEICASQGEMCTTFVVEPCSSVGCPTDIIAETSNCSAIFHVNGIDAADVIWDFGDNSTTIGGIQTEHVYATSGVYVVMATISGTDCPVMNPTGTVNLVYTIEINCSTASSCPTEIIATPGSTCGDYVFELNQANADASITWYPGDETGAVQNNGAFAHNYAAPGTYPVCAWVISPACPNGAEICTNIVVDPCETTCNEGVLTIDSYVLEGGTNALVYSLYSENGFQANGQATYTQNDPYFDLPVCLPDGCYHLTIDNNNPLLIGQGVNLSLVINSVNLLENAEIIYQDDVSVTYLFGVNTDCSTPACEALFNAIYTTTPGHVEFENASIYGGSATFTWDYGNGQTSDGVGGNVQYDSNGLYQVCLTITTPSCTNTYCAPILIEDMVAGCNQNNVVINISANQLPDVTDVIGLSLLFDGQLIEAWSLLVQSGFSATYELCIPDGCYEIGCSSVMPLTAEAFNVTVGNNGSTIGNLQLLAGSSEAMAVFGVNTDCTIHVDETSRANWGLYPNPADEWMQLTFSDALINRSITLMDASGRVVATWNTTQQQWTMDASAFAAGFYLLNVDELGQRTTQTVIIR